MKLLGALAIALTAGVMPNLACGSEVILETDIVYGQGNGKELRLDLARPKRAIEPCAALVFLHSGGWQFGDRKMYVDDIEAAARRGYVAVTATYRLTNPDESGQVREPFPAQIEDAKCVVRWLRENSRRYQIDPKRIGAIGSSAGGHLSLLLGLTDGSHELEGRGGHADRSSRVQAVVNFYGPTDLAQLFATSPKAGKLAATLLGGSPADRRVAYERASPVSYVSEDDPPVLTIQGSEDKLVPLEQAKRLDEAMREAGASHTLLVIEGAGHGFKRETASRTLNVAFEFFDEHLQEKP